MNLINLSDIEIAENRQRREFSEEKLNELVLSIRKCQLMHPVVLRNGYQLVAGERRTIAVTRLHDAGISVYHDSELVPEGMIPYIDLGELDELESKEAELEENTHRADLSFQEQARAVKELHDLRLKQNPSHTVSDTAEEINGRSDGAYHDTVRKQLIIAQHLDSPEVQKAKSLKDAFKALKKKEEMDHRAALGASMASVQMSDLHRIHNADFRSLDLGEGVFDVIITDPPYGMGADTFGDGGRTDYAFTAHTYEDSYETWLPLIKDFAVYSFRVAKPLAHCYAFCDLDRFAEFREIMGAAGWKVHRTPLIYQKPHGADRRVPWPECGPRRSYELVLYAVKGNKPVKATKPDIFTATIEPNIGHPAQKPVSAWAELLSRSVSPGDKIADFFAGSGGILVAGHEAKCEVTAVEIDPAAYVLCAKRLEELK